MVEVKDFKDKKYGYLLENMYTGCNKPPIIKKVEIQKVGRKYTTAGYRNFQNYSGCEHGLISYDYGRTDFLCLTEKDANCVIEKHELRLWFNRLNPHDYTLEQLRKVKEILET